MSKLQESNVANERVYTVEEIAKLARISRTGAYEPIKKEKERKPPGCGFPLPQALQHDL